MHGDLSLAGWFMWVVYALSALLIVAAIAICVDVVRRPDSDLGSFGRLPWVVLQGVLIALTAFAFTTGLLSSGNALPSWFPGLIGLVVLAAMIQQVAYLLRVVYPAPKRRAATRDSADG